MDAIDRKILLTLQRQGDISHADLADAVGASTASCWRRIKAMEAQGVLTGTVRLVDAQKVGLDVNVMISLRIRNHAPETRRSFEDFVAARAEIVACFSMSGEWDYLLRVVVGDVAAYNRFLMQILLAHPAVAQASSHFALAMVKNTTALPIPIQG
jgi:Lrp/AsnC family transcriptional regulator